jgi:type I restriction enzyme, S subunit
MDVKPGYKQTEVGVIPEDWTAVDYISFGQVIDGDRGVHYPGAGDLRNSGYCLFLNAGNVTREGFRFTECQFITSEKDKSLSKGKLTRGDVVLTTRGTLGNFAHFDDDVPYDQVRINSGMVILRNTSMIVRNDYQYLALRSPIVESQIERLSFGSAQPQLTVKGISTLKIPLPPTKAEQEAIAQALSDADAFIKSLEQLIAKKSHLKQGAMQELLTGKKRLPGFSGNWEVKRLGELADIRSGGTPSTSQPRFWDGDILWCTPTDITGLNGFKYLTDTSRKISRSGLKSSSADLIPAQSIVMTSRATIGECAINTVPVSTNQGFKNFIPFEDIDVEFFFYLLLTRKQDFISLCGGSTFLEISKAQLSAFNVRLPRTKTEQTAIASILSDIDAEITALESELAKAQSIKQGMMQELLTGRIRLQ